MVGEGWRRCWRLSADRIVERGLADLDAPRGFSDGKALGHVFACAPEFFLAAGWLASTLAASRRGSGEAGAGAFLDQIPLELAQSRKQVEHKAAAGGGGIDGFGERLEADAALFQGGDGFDEVGQIAAEAVELPHDQHLAVVQVVECCLQAGAIGAGAGGVILEHLGATRRCEGIALATVFTQVLARREEG